MVTYGPLALLFGVALTVIALGFVIFGMIFYGRGRASLVILSCGILLFIDFAIVAALGTVPEQS